MSTIVAVEKDGKVAVASDGGTGAGDTRCVNARRPSKVRRVGKAILGVAGYSVYQNILDDYLNAREPPALTDEKSIFTFFLQLWRELHSRYHFVNDQWDEGSVCPFSDLGAEFLVVDACGIFRVKEILSVTQFERFCAIGSGAPHAEGALSVLYDTENTVHAMALTAVQVAIAFDRSSGGDVDVFELA